MASAQNKFTLHRVRLRHKEGISVEGDGRKKLSWLQTFRLSLLLLH